MYVARFGNHCLRKLLLELNGKPFYIFFFFLAALGLCCGVRASHCGGFSCCGAWASVVVAYELSCCGSQAQ